MRLGRALVLSFFAIALLPNRAMACMCLPDASAACERNISAEVVFVARVDHAGPRYGDLRTAPMRQFHFAVLESFRGLNEREVDIVSSATDCGVDFKEHKEYLIYAWRDETTGRLEAGACSGTALVEDSADDIENLRGLMSGKGPARVFGFATADPSDLQMPFRASRPLVRIPVVLHSGNKVWSTFTDNLGVYEFPDLPGGEYELAAELPNVGSDQKRHVFRLAPGACSRQNFLGEQVARIEGRLTDAENKPVPNVLVEIEGVPPTRQPQPLLRPMTDSEGRFVYDNLEMGEYLLGVNLEEPPFKHDWYGKQLPFARSYYPGVMNRNQAGIVSLKEGKSVADLDFRLPPNPAKFMFQGVVLGASETPVQALVALLDLDYPGDKAQVDAVVSDATGVFSIQGIEGSRYGLLAEIEEKDRVRHSEVVEVASGSIKGLRLILSSDEPVTACEVCGRFTIGRMPLW